MKDTQILKKHSGKIIPKKIPLSQEIKRSIYLLIFTLLGLIVLLSIVFLLNDTESLHKGYILKKEQVDKEDYLLKKRELDNELIETKSYKTIENSEKVKKMEKPEEQIYIE